MTAPYVPQVGDTIRRPTWTVDGWTDVIWIGTEMFVGTDRNGHEEAFSVTGPWVKVDKPEPWPERWSIVWRSPTGPCHLGFYISLKAAVAVAGAQCHLPDDLRIWRSNPDGSVTVLDHTGSELA